MVYRHDFIFIGNDRCGHVSNGDDGMKDDTISRAAEVACGSINSSIYWGNILIQIEQMGYVICKKKKT